MCENRLIIRHSLFLPYQEAIEIALSSAADAPKEARNNTTAPNEPVVRSVEDCQVAQLVSSPELVIEAKTFSSDLEDRTKHRTQKAAIAIAGYWALSKPDVNLLVAVTTGIAFCLASVKGLQSFPVFLLLNTVMGTALVAGGGGALNQYMERRFDARMRRTSRRPLASGGLEPVDAFCFGSLLSVGGALYLAITCGALSAALAVLACVTYLFVYTPLKRVTPLCTLAGAFPGAVPPLIGWAAASGKLSMEAWVLYLFLFLWQLPHFMAIAWMYREDYTRAGYHVLPNGPAKSSFMIWHTLIPLFLVIPVSIMPTLLGYTGRIYAIGAFFLSCLFLWCGLKLTIHRTNSAARRLLFASIAYLPAVLALLMLDRT